MNSPSLSFDDDNTLKAGLYNDQCYQYDAHMPFHPLPPPPIHGAPSPFRNNQNQLNPPLATTLPTQSGLAPPPLLLNDPNHDYSMQNLLHYLIFSNQMAMNLAGLLGPSHAALMMYQLDEQLLTDLVHEFSLNPLPLADLMYTINDFELTTLMESLPLAPTATVPPLLLLQMTQTGSAPTLVDSHFTHPLLVNHSGTDFIGTNPDELMPPGDLPPFTPTLNDFDFGAHTLDPHLHDLTQHHQHQQQHQQQQASAPLPQSSVPPGAPPQGMFTHQQPMAVNPPRGLVHTTPPSQRISKKHSSLRLNVLSNKKNLVISTLTPLSTELLPGFGVSPLCNKYRGLDIHQQPPQPGSRPGHNQVLNALSAASLYEAPPIPPQQLAGMMPPMNVFRHGLESSLLLTAGLFYDLLAPPGLVPAPGPQQVTPGAMTPPLTLTPPRRKYLTLSEVLAQKVKNLSRKQQESVGMLGPLSLPPLIPVPPAPMGANPAPVTTTNPLVMTPTAPPAPPPIMIHGNNSLSLVLSNGLIGLDIGAAVNLAIAAGQKAKKHTRRRLLPRLKNGCWICRIKHLKCDEIRPNCSLCLRFGISCDYLADKPDYVTDKEKRKEKLMSISLLRKQKQQAPKSHSRRQDNDVSYDDLPVDNTLGFFEQPLVNYDS